MLCLWMHLCIRDGLPLHGRISPFRRWAGAESLRNRWDQNSRMRNEAHLTSCRKDKKIRRVALKPTQRTHLKLPFLRTSLASGRIKLVEIKSCAWYKNRSFALIRFSTSSLGFDLNRQTHFLLHGTDPSLFFFSFYTLSFMKMANF